MIDSYSTVTEFSKSTDDLTSIYRTLENENLTFDGKNKQKQRRSAISSSSESDVCKYPSAEKIEKYKKKLHLHSLERTLKVSISLCLLYMIIL